MAKHLTNDELVVGLDEIRGSPADDGRLELIVRRPTKFEREVLEEGELDTVEGLVGDNWNVRGSSMTPDGLSHPDMQINVINARAISLIADDKARWSLAGDQLYVDLELGDDNLPAGIRLEIGSAILEVTAQPHTGCGQFAERFGVEALKFVNSPAGRSLNLRGINARVVSSGVVRTGDRVRKT